MKKNYFEYKTKLIGSTPNNNKILDAGGFVPLKYLSNLWRYIDLSLIKCKTELDLSWSKKCIIFEISITTKVSSNSNVNPSVPNLVAIQITGAAFQINNAKLHVVTLSINDNIKFLENIKQGFKSAIS